MFEERLFCRVHLAMLIDRDDVTFSMQDASSFMFDGELGAPKLQEATFLSSSTGEQENKQLGDELDLSFLPDELSTQEEPASDQNNAGMWTEGAAVDTVCLVSEKT